MLNKIGYPLMVLSVIFAIIFVLKFIVTFKEEGMREALQYAMCCVVFLCLGISMWLYLEI